MILKDNFNSERWVSTFKRMTYISKLIPQEFYLPAEQLLDRCPPVGGINLPVGPPVLTIVRLFGSPERAIERHAQHPEHVGQLFVQVLVPEHAVYDYFAVEVRVLRIVVREVGRLEVLLERHVHVVFFIALPYEVVVGQRLVPGVPLDCELVVAVPDLARYPVPHIARADVAMEFLESEETQENPHHMGEVVPLCELRERVEEAPEVPGRVRLLRPVGGGQHVPLPAEMREVSLNARAGGLARLYEDELVLVGQHHTELPDLIGEF